MKKVGIVHGVVLISLLIGCYFDSVKEVPDWLKNGNDTDFFRCVLAAGFGGITYCARAIYLGFLRYKRWIPELEAWYYVRPFLSLICGGVSFLFLNAGILILGATNGEATNSHFGYYAFAFIAGLNVDKFIQKLEGVAGATWGMEESTTSIDWREKRQKKLKKGV